jgi:hypothetical protein
MKSVNIAETTAAVDLGVGIVAELLQVLDDRRQIRHAARQLRPQPIEQVQHQWLAGRCARRHPLPFQRRDAQAAGMLVGDVIGDRHAVGVDSTPPEILSVSAARFGLRNRSASSSCSLVP